jgi:trans-aconitate 2-methyltransferase
MGASYTFGDTQTARDRLDLVAATFDPPSRAFLSAMVPEPPRLAYDLGCGPGHTTRMIKSATRARQVVGLDRSADFLRAAAGEKAFYHNGLGFSLWEAGSPLPAAEPPDLIYARLFLAHLPDPAAHVASWATQLAPGGRLLLDEVERIDTDSDVLRDYLVMVVARVRNGGAEMYAGPLLDGLPLPATCSLVHDEVVTHPVAAADAARMFRLNLAVWGDDPWVARRFGPGAASTMDRELSRIAEGTAGSYRITWHLRHLAIRRSNATPWL